MIIDPEGTFTDLEFGSDANAGTINNPVATIAQAISIAETHPGHPIYVFAKPEKEEYINGRKIMK